MTDDGPWVLTGAPDASEELPGQKQPAERVRRA